MQVSPPGWQAVEVVPHFPDVHVPEQHCEAAVQLVASARHWPTGSVQ